MRHSRRSWWGGVAAGFAVLLAVVGGGCSSVQLPAERFFVLVQPEAAADNAAVGEPVVDVLRVLDLMPTGAVDRDHPVWRRGHEVVRSPHERWLAPLDQLATDALRTGLARCGCARLVKGAVDPGAEDWQLHGRILDFAVVEGPVDNMTFVAASDAAVATAMIRVELWLTVAGELRFRAEFEAAEPLDGGAERDQVSAAVAAFSQAFGRLVEQVDWRLRALPPGGPAPGTSPGR